MILKIPYSFLFIALFIYSCNETRRDIDHRQTKLSPFDSLAIRDSLNAYDSYQDSKQDANSVKLTFKLINAFPDTLNVTDSTISTKNGIISLQYSLFQVSRHANGLKYVIAIIPKLEHTSASRLKESILKAISKRDTIYELQLYHDLKGFYEMVKNDAPKTVQEAQEKADVERSSYIGILHHGKYHENYGVLF